MGWFWSEVGSLVIIVEEVGPKWWWSLRVLEVVVLAGFGSGGPCGFWKWVQSGGGPGGFGSGGPCGFWKWWSLRVWGGSKVVVVLAGLK